MHDIFYAEYFYHLAKYVPFLQNMEMVGRILRLSVKSPKQLRILSEIPLMHKRNKKKAKRLACAI